MPSFSFIRSCLIAITLTLCAVAMSGDQTGVARAQPTDSPCPSSRPSQIKNDLYHFQYDSVRTPGQPDTTIVSRCLRNVAPVEMKFRWEKVPLDGWLTRAGTFGAVAEHSISVFNTTPLDFADSPLWYGTAWRRTTAPYLTRKTSAVTTALPPATAVLDTKAVLSMPINPLDLDKGFVTFEVRFRSSLLTASRSIFTYGSSIRVLDGSTDSGVIAKLKLAGFSKAPSGFLGEAFGPVASFDRTSKTVDATAFTAAWQGSSALFTKSNVATAEIVFFNQQERQVGRTGVDLFIPAK